MVLLAIATPLCAAPPPSRPLPLTRGQFAAVCQVEQQPEHVAIRQIHATYQSEQQRRWEKTRCINDATTFATFAGYIGAIATILICAAPL
jgi:hypothetical protein